MPQVNRALMVQLGIILLIVPVQYFISQRWKPSSHTKQQQTVKEFVTQLKAWKDSIFTTVTWKKWFHDAKNYMTTYKDSAIEKAKQFTSTTTSSSGLSTYQDGAEADLDDTAMNILKKRDPAGNFGSSAVPRNPRPANIKFRVGQVIRHKKYGYRGVIVGWDATAKAPENWLNQMHGKNRPPADMPFYTVLVDISFEFYEDGTSVYIPEDMVSVLTADTKHLRHLPNYSVLVDVRDRHGSQVTYVVEENIEIITNHEVKHPEVKDYFNGFDGVQYIAKPWLKILYPHDQ